MTINKSQGRTLERVAIYLPRPCFSPGQLYVALSRARQATEVSVISATADSAEHTGTVQNIKLAKRKKVHAFKSKMRLEQLEVSQNKRQNAWQQFQTTKGRAKKVGFFSGRKRESIFKSPEDPFGKVGVTGSGKGLTDFQRREKHLHLKGANIDNENADD